MAFRRSAVRSRSAPPIKSSTFESRIASDSAIASERLSELSSPHSQRRPARMCYGVTRAQQQLPQSPPRAAEASCRESRRIFCRRWRVSVGASLPKPAVGSRPTRPLTSKPSPSGRRRSAITSSGQICTNESISAVGQERSRSCGPILRGIERAFRPIRSGRR